MLSCLSSGKKKTVRCNRTFSFFEATVVIGQFTSRGSGWQVPVHGNGGCVGLLCLRLRGCSEQWQFEVVDIVVFFPSNMLRDDLFPTYCQFAGSQRNQLASLLPAQRIHQRAVCRILKRGLRRLGHAVPVDQLAAGGKCNTSKRAWKIISLVPNGPNHSTVNTVYNAD